MRRSGDRKWEAIEGSVAVIEKHRVAPDEVWLAVSVQIADERKSRGIRGAAAFVEGRRRNGKGSVSLSSEQDETGPCGWWAAEQIVVRDEEIDLAVAVEICRREGHRTEDWDIDGFSCGLKGSVSIPFVEVELSVLGGCFSMTDTVSRLNDDGVDFAVAIEVRCGGRARDGG